MTGASVDAGAALPAFRNEQDERSDISSHAPRWSEWILLAALMGAFMFSAIDRLLIGLLVEPIKADLGLTDTLMGVLQGFAFMLIYATAAIPAGIMIDRYCRTRLIAGAIALWSVMTALCGLANSFWTLFAARSGVGIGESVLTPAATALMTERFPARMHALVFGIYGCGGTLGGGLTFFLGGSLYAVLEKGGARTFALFGTVQPWQMTFVVMSLPSLLLAGLIWLIPDRRNATPAVTTRSKGGHVRPFLQSHWRTLLPHHLASGFSNFVLAAVVAWVAAFFVRVHHLPIAQVSIMVGSATLGGGVVGLLVGGALSDMLSRGGAHRRLVFNAVICGIGATASLGLALSESSIVAALFLAMITLCSAVPVTAANAALQQIVPQSIRGTISAVFLFAISLMGAAGPVGLALIGDIFFPTPEGIRSSFALVIPIAYLLSAALFLMTIRPYRRSFAGMNRER